MPLLCPLCPAERTQNLGLTISDYLRHLRLFHAHQPHFHLCCGINGCQRTFKNFGTYKNHISDRHTDDQLWDTATSSHDPPEELTNYDTDTGSPEPANSQDSETLGTDIATIAQRSSAFFLMGLKEEKRLTQVALQGVIDGVTTLSQSRLSLLHQEVTRTLKDAGVPKTSLEGIDHLFDDSGIYGRPFIGLETHHQQLKYYSDHFGMKEPRRVHLGERHVWKGTGVKRRCVVKQDEFMYVPLLSTLQSCLSNESFADKITIERPRNLECLEDYSDGSAFCNHPLFSKKKRALQLLLYYDEVEVCNPLGSKKKIHKLGMFYFHLGNLHPKHRSKLISIQLLGIVKSKHISEYGMDFILRPMVDDIKKLEEGVYFTVKGKSELWFGTVAICSADNLGSLLLGGFKESCSADKCCRHCLTTRTLAKQKFLECDFVLRDKETHKKQCSEIEQDSSGGKSKEYGVNRDSVLNELEYFHVCDGGLLPDVMHDLLEGALQYEVKAMLNVMIYSEQYFTLEFVNTRLEHLELGYMEAKNRPTLLEESKIRAPSGLSLSQNASQMWLLARILPLLVGDSVPDDDQMWLNFLTMMDIVDRLFCPRLTNDDATYLKFLISDHHNEFVSLYPYLSVIPKMHFMVHMPRLIKRFGPLVRHWTMRFEAKHSYFKHLAQSMGNFINLPYSLATRHQQLQCYKNMSTSSGSDLTVGPGITVVREGLPIEEVVTSVYRAKWITLDGVEFKKDAGVVYEMNNDLPLVGKIESILIANNSKVFLEVACFSTYYEEHFRAYILQSLNSDRTLSVDNIICNPLHIRKASSLPGCQFIILPHHIHVE